MLQQLNDVIAQITQKEVGNTPNVNNQLAQDIAKETGVSVVDGLKSAISGGNISEIFGNLSNLDVNSLSSSPLVENIIQSTTSKFTDKLGIDSQTASSLANNIIPQVLSSLKSGNFNVQDIIGNLIGGKSGLDLDVNNDGKLGIDDAISALKDGNIGNILGGLFKK